MSGYFTRGLLKAKRALTSDEIPNDPVPSVEGRSNFMVSQAETKEDFHMSGQVAKGPLDGIRVLDLTSVIMGPLATHILADLGADVIKVESPQGDLLRRYLPLRNQGMSGCFLHLHRNKRSICLDLKSDEGRGVLDRLITKADVFVHTMRLKTIERLGYSYERIRGLNSDVIYCGAFGFGSGGPYSDKAAYDDLIQAGSGMAALCAVVQGKPAYVPSVICDKLAGQAIAYSILARLFHRARGGGGQAIEVPMFEASVEFNLIEHFGGFAFEPELGQPGFWRVLNKQRKPYHTKDGDICILPYSDKNWQDFYKFTGRNEFRDDLRFQRLSNRTLYIDILYRMIEEEALKRTTAEWVEFCDRVSIPCMPVISLQELPDDPHIKAVGLFETAEHPTEGRYRVLRRPVSFSNAPFQLTRHAPQRGEHTTEILAESGFSSEQIRKIHEINVAALAKTEGSGYEG
jgi:crotonobetainyl-CoA:carnitine CoA-transferase CaiB-like acyl-CoA transferase